MPRLPSGIYKRNATQREGKKGSESEGESEGEC